MLGRIIKSLTVLGLVSTVVSACFYTDVYSFLRYFSITTFIQIVVYNVYVTLVMMLHDYNENTRLAELSKQVVDIKCPCPKGISQVVPVSLNEPTSYKCQECTRSVVAMTDVKAFLSTEPVDVDHGNTLLEKIYNEAIKNKSHGNTTI